MILNNSRVGTEAVPMNLVKIYTLIKELETLLVKCEYQVTTTNQAIKALKILRENRNKFDLIISDVNMPDMDGFKLLELVRLETDLPFIMMSAHSDTRLVMKAVTNGACDYLLKPVRMEELKHIWQHVVRRKKIDKKDQNKPSQVKKANNMAGEGNTSKPRVIWSPEQHKKFVAAIYRLGLERAVPRKVLEMMNVEGLTCENVASHLQECVTHGACDYLLKPVRMEELKLVRMEELKNIWQHVVRRKKFDKKDQNKASQLEKANNMAREGDQGISSENNLDQSKILGKRRKDQSEDEEEDGEDNAQENEEDPSTQKRPRVVWSVELHGKFVAAVDQLGLEKAVPMKILDLMNVEGLTRGNVESHLQKYRIYLKKATLHAKISSALGGESSYSPIVECFR